MSSTAENEIEINPNDEDCLDTLNLVDKAIVTRGSTRAFLSTPVEPRLIQKNTFCRCVGTKRHKICSRGKSLSCREGRVKSFRIPLQGILKR